MLREKAFANANKMQDTVAWKILLTFKSISVWGLIVKLLALALTNLVLSLVNLVTNLAKPSLGQPSYLPDQT